MHQYFIFSWFYYIAKVEDPFPETPDSHSVCHLLRVAIVKVSCCYRWFKFWWTMELFDNQWCTRADILEQRVDRSFYHRHHHLELATCPLRIIRNCRGCWGRGARNCCFTKPWTWLKSAPKLRTLHRWIISGLSVVGKQFAGALSSSS